MHYCMFELFGLEGAVILQNLRIGRRKLLSAKIASEIYFYIKISEKRHQTQYSVANGSKVMGRHVPVSAIFHFTRFGN